MNSKKAIVTEEHREEAALLSALWDRLPHPNQTIFGEQYDVGSQSAVGQFLRGDTPLSLKAAAGFAMGLGVKISEFSPRLAKQAMHYAELSGASAPALNITDLNKIEAQLVLMLRAMSPDLQAELVQIANKLHNQERPAKSAANPFPGVPLPPKTSVPAPKVSRKKTESAEH